VRHAQRLDRVLDRHAPTEAIGHRATAPGEGKEVIQLSVKDEIEDTLAAALAEGRVEGNSCTEYIYVANM
jgi:hypothetical protein